MEDHRATVQDGRPREGQGGQARVVWRVHRVARQARRSRAHLADQRRAHRQDQERAQGGR